MATWKSAAAAISSSRCLRASSRSRSSKSFSVIHWIVFGEVFRTGSCAPSSGCTISSASSIIATTVSTMLFASRTTSVCATFCASSASLVRGVSSSAARSASRRTARATSVICCADSKSIRRSMAVCVALMSL